MSSFIVYLKLQQIKFLFCFVLLGIFNFKSWEFAICGVATLVTTEQLINVRKLLETDNRYASWQFAI